MHGPPWEKDATRRDLLRAAAGGGLAGLLGVGGGIVIVPVLFQMFELLAVPDDIRMHLAVGTSLTTIVATSLISARAHDRRGSLDRAMLRRWWPGSCWRCPNTRSGGPM